MSDDTFSGLFPFDTLPYPDVVELSPPGNDDSLDAILDDDYYVCVAGPPDEYSPHLDQPLDGRTDAGGNPGHINGDSNQGAKLLRGVQGSFASTTDSLVIIDTQAGPTYAPSSSDDDLDPEYGLSGSLCVNLSRYARFVFGIRPSQYQRADSHGPQSASSSNNDEAGRQDVGAGAESEHSSSSFRAGSQPLDLVPGEIGLTAENRAWRPFRSDLGDGSARPGETHSAVASTRLSHGNIGPLRSRQAVLARGTPRSSSFVFPYPQRPSRPREPRTEGEGEIQGLDISS